ncbi:MAG: phosphoenolpyruvate synthase [Nanoarchaeota archaeon]
MLEEKKVSGTEEPDIAFVKWFSELDKTSGPIAGGKGANLSEIYNLKISVPPGFVVTAQAYDHFIKGANLNDKIKILLGKIDYENTKKLDEITKEIRELIVEAPMPPEIEEEISDAYETLSAEKSKEMKADHLLKKSSENVFVAVRSSATTEDLAEASFAGQQETFLNVHGNESLLTSIKKCFASLFTPRATYYRNKKGFKYEQASLAVVVQKMVNSDKSGVIFSKDPSQNREDVIIEAVFGLGEGIVSGQITPDRYIVSRKGKIIEKEVTEKKIAIIKNSEGKQETIKLKPEISKKQVLKDHEVTRLADIGLKLESHYGKPQDIEFAIENDEIYIVQTRPITTLEKRFLESEVKELKGEVILSGLAASPGIGVGKVKIVHDLKELSKVVSGDILVTEMTNPDMVVTMQRCSAIITNEGGLTAHAAIVSREMGIPAVVGTREATTRLQEGEVVTVNGFTGKIYRGKVAESAQKQVNPVTAKTKTQLKVILDLPSFAARAASTGIKSIGLARLEGIIAESGKHPNYFLGNKRLADYEEIIFKGISKIAEPFEEVWVRTSDIRSDEFQNLQGAPEKVEGNPMLGMHGIRFSLKYPEILKAELNAMKRISEKNSKEKKIGIMAPQVISIEEVKQLKKMILDIGFKDAKIGVMVETPAAVEIIEEICDEGIDFISFGTNDLTQYTLAIDRGNEQVQNLYNEMHPSVLAQISHVIKICKEKGVESSICGQAGINKEMVKFLVSQGISSISVNADVAADIAQYIFELESKISPTNDSIAKNEEIKEEVKKEIGDTIETGSKRVEEAIKKEVKEHAVPILSSPVADYTTYQNEETELPVIPGSEYTEKTETIEENEDKMMLNIF